MKGTKFVFLAVSMVVSALTAAVLALSIHADLSAPLDERLLGSIRGADFDYTENFVNTCEQGGVMALSMLLSQSVSPASSCASVNLGFPCGDCTMERSTLVGSIANPSPPGMGMSNSDLGGCGFVRGGTCGVADPSTSPPTYGCVNQQIKKDSNNNPYSCTNLIGLKSQAS